MRGKNLRTRFRLLFLIIGMDGEQGFALLNAISHLVINDKTHGVIHRIGLFGAARAETHRCFAYAARVDLGQPAASTGFPMGGASSATTSRLASTPTSPAS